MARNPHEEGSFVDFNIGHFVSLYDSLKVQLGTFDEFFHATNSLRRWEVPSLTFLCCVFVTTLCIAVPEFLLVFSLSPIPLALLVTGIKNLGQKEGKQVRHIVVMPVESDEEKLKRKKEMIEKATKDLRRFVKIMRELQYWMKEVNKKLEFLHSLFSWEDPQLTLRFMGCVFALMFSFTLFPISFILLMGFFVVFLKNEGFIRVLFENLSVLGIYDPGDKTVDDNDKEVDTVEWFDASSTLESFDSSCEDESNESESERSNDNFDVSVNLGSAKRTRSLVSHFSEYRRRRQEFNKGYCAACDVAFSSLLTRRRYCRRCGDKFCSKCCRHTVTKAALGATAPGSRDLRVLVCNDCYGKLRATKVPD